MKNLSVKIKLAILVGSMAVLLVVIGVTGLSGMNRTVAGLETVYEDRTVVINQLTEIRHLLNQNRYALVSSVVTPSEEYVRRQANRVEGNISRIDEIWSDYLQTYLTPEEEILAGEFAEVRGAFVDALREVVIELREGEIEYAEMMIQSQIRPLYEPVGEAIAALVDLQVQVAGEEYGAATAAYARQRNLTVGIILIGLLLSGIFSILLLRGITGPLDRALQIARGLAEGDLTQKIEVGSRDEIGRLLEAMQDMIARLTQVVGEVNGASSALASASEEVSSTAQSLSQGASEQAAGVEQTTSSVEQMSASIEQNNENARITNDMADKAAREAAEGGEAVGKTVDAMKSIAEKISIIDEIAYQTNLLALNAAIEAARAGEHGKGFAVVAAEVRKLAERSQVAAQEIGEVAQGSVGLAEQAGELLERMVPSIQKTSDLVKEISAASTEQAAGARQINDAMGQLNSTTEQAASSSEELASTSEEMSGQAEQLQQLMTFFRVSEAGFVGGGELPASDSRGLSSRRGRRPSEEHGNDPVAPRKAAIRSDSDESDFVRF
ncbi:methyl-accepting chemotaxis protein [Wenzhouxiangella sp. AB-CW3]|uniref:methyl-accepting chemotaxis protein n=1 Tax=Wenzhouxiangella sp. AB-CW3 TaxID=2771012 RepID=UPI001CC30914|nr:methyl-accepting chemotaxis protein [Wenzhouxiangella sp. AB-CW3]